MATELRDLEMSLRLYNGLADKQIKTIEQLANTTDAQLLTGNNFGKKTLHEARLLLLARGYVENKNNGRWEVPDDEIEFHGDDDEELDVEENGVGNATRVYRCSGCHTPFGNIWEIKQHKPSCQASLLDDDSSDLQKLIAGNLKPLDSLIISHTDALNAAQREIVVHTKALDVLNKIKQLASTPTTTVIPEENTIKEAA